MLNRRFLRVKVMQALYSYHQNEAADLIKFEKELFKSIHKVYDLYLYLLCIIPDITHIARLNIETNKLKRLPTEEDLLASTRFVDNKAIRIIEENIQLKKLIEVRKIQWQNEHDIPKKIFKIIRDSPEYENYMLSKDNSFKNDRDFLFTIFRKYIGENEMVHYLMEEANIHWYGDIVLANLAVQKLLEGLTEKITENTTILPELYKDEKDDVMFVKELFLKTIINDTKLEKYIAEKTENWEVDRIALIDIILMKMALTEFLHFNSIPVKVTINEYIELSKSYSTTKSKVFINGVLDRLLIELKQKKEINKIGRGLLE